VRHDALSALKLANRPPRCFRRAGGVSRLGGNPETRRPAFEPLSPEPLRGVPAEGAGRGMKARGGTDGRVIVPACVADALAGLRDPGLPGVGTVVEAPFFTAGGRLVVRPGSDPESMSDYHAPSLALPPVPERPTAEDIDRGEGPVL